MVLDEIDNLTDKPGEKNNNRTEVLADVLEEDVNSGDTDDVYSKVFQPSTEGTVVPKARTVSVPPRPAVRRKKRKERGSPAQVPGPLPPLNKSASTGCLAWLLRAGTSLTARSPY